MFVCHICGSRCATPNLLIGHLKVIHSFGKNSTFLCTEKCGQVFQNASSFKKHITNCKQKVLHKNIVNDIPETIQITSDQEAIFCRAETETIPTEINNILSAATENLQKFDYNQCKKSC